MSEVPTETFRVTLPPDEAGGVGRLLLPFDPRERFGRARPPVVVTIGDHRFRSTVSIMRGQVFVPLRRSHRETAGVAAGETIEVTLTLDTAPRTVEPPADLAAALGATGAGEAWERLSFTHQREWAEAIDGAKRPETRAKRIAACVAKLAGPPETRRS